MKAAPVHSRYSSRRSWEGRRSAAKGTPRPSPGGHLADWQWQPAADANCGRRTLALPTHLPISITAPAVLRLAGAAARTKHELAFASGCVGKRQTLSITLDGERPGGQVCTLGSKVIMELFEVGELQRLQEFAVGGQRC